MHRAEEAATAQAQAKAAEDQLRCVMCEYICKIICVGVCWIMTIFRSPRSHNQPTNHPPRCLPSFYLHPTNHHNQPTTPLFYTSFTTTTINHNKRQGPVQQAAPRRAAPAALPHRHHAGDGHGHPGGWVGGYTFGSVSVAVVAVVAVGLVVKGKRGCPLSLDCPVQSPWGPYSKQTNPP